MSCGGNAKVNRNAAAIKAAVEQAAGLVSVEEARAQFHRLADEARAEETAYYRRVREGRDPDQAARLEITQAAHASARQRIGMRVARMAEMTRDAEPLLATATRRAAELRGAEPDLVPGMTDDEAAQALRLAVRREIRSGADGFPGDGTPEPGDYDDDRLREVLREAHSQRAREAADPFRNGDLPEPARSYAIVHNGHVLGSEWERERSRRVAASNAELARNALSSGPPGWSVRPGQTGPYAVVEGVPGPDEDAAARRRAVKTLRDHGMIVKAAGSVLFVYDEAYRVDEDPM